jgi:hypothetical protein
LSDHRDALALSCTRIPAFHVDIVHDDVAFIRSVYTGDDLAQGRFPGPVLADERVNLSTPDVH